MLAVTAAVSDSTAGVSLEEAEQVQALSSGPTRVQQQEKRQQKAGVLRNDCSLSQKGSATIKGARAQTLLCYKASARQERGR